MRTLPSTFHAGSCFLALFAIASCPAPAQEAPTPRGACNAIRRTVDRAILPLMAKDGIPGIAVGVIDGNTTCIVNEGVASFRTRKPVTGDTLFEIGSVSKTFTATLASRAQLTGHLSLNDTTSRYLPSLRGTPFGAVTLVELGTHTPGGLPLQLPDGIDTQEQLLRYFQKWRPRWAPGTVRTYNNPGIGTLGLIAARSMDENFAVLDRRLFTALGLRNTFLDVPASRWPDYAQGYTQNGTPIRMTGGVISQEAWGVRTTAADLVRFLQANMGRIPLDPTLQAAVTATHTGYFRAGPMTQDLIWEQYPWPVSLPTLLEGNDSAMIFGPMPVAAITPPEKPRSDVLINKTGSTNGFGAYVAFVPAQRLGIVILANKSHPIGDRVAAAWQILTALATGSHP